MHLKGTLFYLTNTYSQYNSEMKRVDYVPRIVMLMEGTHYIGQLK
jgi:hypothetical protein